jgi:hypothetical protein
LLSSRRRLWPWLRLDLWPCLGSRESLRLRLRSRRSLRLYHPRLLRLMDHSLRHLLWLIRRWPRRSRLWLRSWLRLRWRQSSHLWLRTRSILLRAFDSISCALTLDVRNSRLLAIDDCLLPNRLTLRLLLPPNCSLLKLLRLARSHCLGTRLRLRAHLFALSLLHVYTFSALRLKLLALKPA